MTIEKLSWFCFVICHVNLEVVFVGLLPCCLVALLPFRNTLTYSVAK